MKQRAVPSWPAILLAALLWTACATGTEPFFENLGLGGGGTFQSPASSPHNPRLMFVSCDMGGFYRSDNGGASWRMVDGRQMGTGCRPVFHPTDPNIVLGYDGREFGSGLLRLSRDAGRTWEPLAGNTAFRGPVASICWARGDPPLLLASRRGQVFRSTSLGKTWEDCGIAGRFFHAGPRACFAAGKDGVYRSDDGGKQWQRKTHGLPEGHAVRGFCGASRDRNTVLYCILDGVKGKVYRSVDGGTTWRAVGMALPDLQFSGIDAAAADTSVVYVHTTGRGGDGRIFRSQNAGETWWEVFHPRGTRSRMNVEHGWLGYDTRWEYGVEHLAVNEADSSLVMIADSGQLMVTRNGGKTWRQAYTFRMPGQGRPGRRQRWSGIGLEVSGVPRVRFDPFDPDRLYLAYFDFGFARSADGGRSWQKGKPGCPWGTATYDVAADPDRKGVLYGAMSSTHDIPYWRYVRNWETVKYRGGVSVSTDHGASWRPVFRKGPCTSILLDPKSPKDARTLYVTSYAHGLYKSTNAGRSWELKSDGLIREDNRHVYQVRSDCRGTLYCSVTVSRTGRDPGAEASWTPGGLYRSADGAESWELVNAKTPLHWPIDFACHPSDPGILYIAARNLPGKPQGGIYKTSDRGKTWQRILEAKGFEGCFSVAVHPDKPDVVYACSWGRGLLRSRDAGQTWEDVRGVPAMFILRVFFDPRHISRVYVSTTGSSVWRGPAF